MTPAEEKFGKDQYDFAAKSHWAWQISAEDLRRALNLVYSDVKRDFNQFLRGKPSRPFAPYRACKMLAGLMLENLLKGVLVSRHGAFDSKGVFAHKTHNLIELAKRAKIPLSPEEEAAMKRLTRSVTWAGRYPIPLVYEQPVFGDGGGYLGKKGDIEVAMQLANRIRKVLPARIKRRRIKKLRHK